MDTKEEDQDPVAELVATIQLHQSLADHARAELDSVSPILVDAIRRRSGQGQKIEALLWSCWNGELCEETAGLDTRLAQAVLAMIAGRIYLGGDADDLIRRVIDESGSQPPRVVPES